MVNYQFRLLILVAIVLGLASCNRVELPDPQHEGVRYELKGLLNGEYFYMGIGTPEFEMDPHHSLDSLNVWRLSGTLKSKYSHGLPHFTFSLRNYQEGALSTMGTKTIIHEGDHDIFIHKGIDRNWYPLNVQLSNDDNIIVDSITVLNQTIPAHSNHGVFNIEQPRDVPVSLLYSLPDGTKCEITTHMDTKKADRIMVVPNWHVFQSADNRAILKAHVNDYDIYQFASIRWSTGEYTESIEVQEPGWYSLTITDMEGQTFTHSKYLYKYDNEGFVTHGNQLKILGGWLDPVTETDHSQLGSIELIYTDTSGQVYKPDFNNNIGQKVNIRRVNPPRIHPNQDISFDIEVQFSANLISATGDQVVFKDITGIISIGIPAD